MNLNLLKKEGNILVSGVTLETLEKCEAASGVSFPEDYKALLRFSDGCMLKTPTFVIFFSCGDGFHEKETLAFANALMPDSGMYFIGRFAGEMFGYLKASDDHRIYSYFEESGEKTLIANDLEEFAQKYLVNQPKKGFWTSLFS